MCTATAHMPCHAMPLQICIVCRTRMRKRFAKPYVTNCGVYVMVENTFECVCVYVCMFEWMSWIVLITHWWQNYFEFWARIQNHSHIGRSLTYVFYYIITRVEVFVLMVWWWWQWRCACVRASVLCMPIHLCCRNSQRHWQNLSLRVYPQQYTYIHTVQRGYEQTYHKFERKRCAILLISLSHTHTHTHVTGTIV